MDLNLLQILSGFTSATTTRSTTSHSLLSSTSASTTSQYQKSSGSSIAPAPAPASSTSEFSTQYKAKPIKFTNPSLQRFITQTQRRKSARLAIVMEKRNISNNTTNSSIGSSMADSSASAAGNHTAEDRRRHLEKWKQEKKLREAAANARAVPAFKVGVAHPPIGTVPVVPSCPSTAVNAFDFRKPKLASGSIGLRARPLTASAAMAAPSQPKERMLTRNMAKLAVASSVPVIRPPGNSITAQKKPTTVPKPKDKKPSVPSPTLRVAQNKIMPAFSTAEIQTESMEAISKSIQTEVETISTPPPPPAPKKKPKGMNFDETFLKYNKSFVDTCARLSQKSKKWTQVINANEVPEEFHGEVHSVLGSTLQLLQSKMPQFAELLGFYLLKNQDPVPTLPHDLEGWWEVAMIQVEKTFKAYEKLDVMEARDWKAPEPQTPKQKKTAAVARVLNENAENIPPPKAKGIKAKASSGLKAFLASKRGNADSQNLPMAMTGSPGKKIETTGTN